MAMSPRSSRRPLKVGPSQAPEPECPPGYYKWRNYFDSGCDPIDTDRRRLGIGGKTLWARIRAGEPVGRARGGAVGAVGAVGAGEADGLEYSYGRRHYGAGSARRYGSTSSRRGTRSPRYY
jgi:hypothetical protein